MQKLPPAAKKIYDEALARGSAANTGTHTTHLPSNQAQQEAWDALEAEYEYADGK